MEEISVTGPRRRRAKLGPTVRWSGLLGLAWSLLLVAPEAALAQGIGRDPPGERLPGGSPAFRAGLARAGSPEDPSGRELYEAGCALCHGPDGRGADREKVAFDIPLPDFSDCSFASREPDPDWIAIAHQGGPVRGFDRTMPAFGEAFTEEQLQAIIGHVRTFCDDPAWPRGELNFPRPLVTEKAFPEDELVYEIGVRAEAPGAVGNAIVYERRFGPRSQIEVVVPFGFQDLTSVPIAAPADTAANEGGWKAGLGDVVVGVKHAFLHSLRSGSILSASFEVKLPTGTTSNGFGAGTTRLEPFLAFGQVLPGEAFLQAQGGWEISTDTEKAPSEAFWRAAFGRTWTQGWGRAWTPMVEILGSTEFETGSVTAWSVVPQLQVTLSKRQHVMANIGVGLPLNDTAIRSPEILFYVLWDWFDGGFFTGW